MWHFWLMASARTSERGKTQLWQIVCPHGCRGRLSRSAVVPDAREHGASMCTVRSAGMILHARGAETKSSEQDRHLMSRSVRAPTAHPAELVTVLFHSASRT